MLKNADQFQWIMHVMHISPDHREDNQPKVK